MDSLYSFLLLDVAEEKWGGEVAEGVVLCPLLQYIGSLRLGQWCVYSTIRKNLAGGSALSPLSRPSPETQKMAVPRSRFTSVSLFSQDA